MKSRSLYQIVSEIHIEWSKQKNGIHYTAKPYLDALLVSRMQSINEHYGFDSGREIVLYLLSNASQFRGEKAKELKAELKELLK